MIYRDPRNLLSLMQTLGRIAGTSFKVNYSMLFSGNWKFDLIKVETFGISLFSEWWGTSHITFIYHVLLLRLLFSFCYQEFILIFQYLISSANLVSRQTGWTYFSKMLRVANYDFLHSGETKLVLGNNHPIAFCENFSETPKAFSRKL